MKKISISFFAVILSVLLFGGCASNNEKTEVNGSNSVHAVKSEKLNSVMVELDSVINKEFDSKIEKENLQLEYSKELLQLSSTITADIKEINSIGQNLTLDKNQKKVFMMLAKELEKENENLRVIIEKYETKKIKQSIEKMRDICNRCHLKYRS